MSGSIPSDTNAAAAAGLHVGAVVVAVNGQVVSSATSWAQCIRRLYTRAREPSHLNLTLARRTRQVVVDRTEQSFSFGLTLCASPRGIGALVVHVPPNSLGERHGLQVGDTILSVNGKIGEGEQRISELLSAERHTTLVLETFTKDLSFLLSSRLVKIDDEALREEDPLLTLRKMSDEQIARAMVERCSDSDGAPAPLSPRAEARHAAMRSTTQMLEAALAADAAEEAEEAEDLATFRADAVDIEAPSAIPSMEQSAPMGADAVVVDERIPDLKLNPLRPSVGGQQPAGRKPDAPVSSAPNEVVSIPSVERARRLRGISRRTAAANRPVVPQRACFRITAQAIVGDLIHSSNMLASEMDGKLLRRILRRPLAEILEPALTQLKMGVRDTQPFMPLANVPIPALFARRLTSMRLVVNVDGREVNASTITPLELIKSAYEPVIVVATLLQIGQSMPGEGARAPATSTSGGGVASAATAGTVLGDAAQMSEDERVAMALALSQQEAQVREVEDQQLTMALAASLQPSPPTTIPCQVTVPPGCGPGQVCSVQAPDGRQMQITIPPGLNPGDALMVMLPEAPSAKPSAPPPPTAPAPTTVHTMPASAPSGQSSMYPSPPAMPQRQSPAAEESATYFV